jgi:hypothetical protein
LAIIESAPLLEVLQQVWNKEVKSSLKELTLGRERTRRDPTKRDAWNEACNDPIFVSFDRAMADSKA